MTQFKSTHDLPFLQADWYDPEFNLFKIGTCEGMWSVNKTAYIIVAITNSNKGNGHLQDVFDWFENSCKRDGKKLQVVEIMNSAFMVHLINKRGFKKIQGDNVEKSRFI